MVDTWRVNLMLITECWHVNQRAGVCIVQCIVYVAYEIK